MLIHEPAWVSYPEQVRLCHGRPILLPHDTQITDYRRFITERTRAVVVNNPNNPTGRVLTHDEWRELHRVAVERDLYIVSDEAYSDYVLDPADFISAGAFDPDKSHTIVCNSLSKNYGVSGWRLGYAITNAALLHQILKLNQHLITCPATILPRTARRMLLAQERAAPLERTLGVISRGGVAGPEFAARRGRAGSAPRGGHLTIA